MVVEKVKVFELGSGRVLSYRRGSNTQYVNQVLIKVTESITKKVDNLIGAKVLVVDQKNKYYGRVVKVHARGKNGVVIAVFNRNLPGQLLGSKAVIYRVKA